MTVSALRSSRVVFQDGVRPATIVIDRNRIAEVLPGRVDVPGVEDLGDWVIGPGLVDCHVHINEPGRSDWEGFETATRAAAAGGVTALVDMPLNSLPVTTTPLAFLQKLEASRGQCFVDVGFWGGVVPGNTSALPELARAGVLGCKTFLVHSGIEEFPNTTEDDLREAMPVLRDAGLPLLAHAELDIGDTDSSASDARGRGTQADPRSYRSYLATRPPSWEEAAIRLLIGLCREYRCPVHIVHLSSASAIPMLRAAKAEGLPITVETCPHYLCLEAEQVSEGATHFKCAPPIRDHANREALWRALLEGVIDFVITDHSPCTPDLKIQESGDFLKAWGGIASLQLGLPAIWTEARRRGADVTQLFRWMSSAPAEFAGLSARKGKIAPGMDADLVVWDPDERVSVQADRLFFRHKLSPYLGMHLEGRVHRTLLRGQPVYDGARPLPDALGKPLLHRHSSAAE